MNISQPLAGTFEKKKDFAKLGKYPRYLNFAGGDAPKAELHAGRHVPSLPITASRGTVSLLERDAV
jgi:hypothetical protein